MTISEQTTPNSMTLSQSSEELLLSPKDTTRIISWANEQFTKMKNERSTQERQWYLNLAFYFGKQNVQFLNANDSTKSFKLYTPPAPYYRSRPVTNLIRPLIRTEMSKLTSQKPSAFVIPASSDDRDMYAAQAGGNIWDYVYREKKLHSVFRRSIFWTCLTGNGFIKSYWNPDALDPFNQVPGDLSYEPITPFHFFVPDEKEEELENQPFVLHASIQSADKLSMMYGREISFERAKGDLLEDSFLNAIGASQWEKQRTVLLLEFWLKPGQVRMFPEGGLLTVAGNQVLAVPNGYPYAHNKYPFAHLPHIPSGKFYRDSIINDLIPLQREYNRTRGQIIESKNRMAKPQLAAEMGSVDPNKITSEPGQVILYRPGFQAPQPIPLQPIPSYVLNELSVIRGDMDEISGQHEVSRGQVPPGVTAATAISYLQEQDETKLSFAYDAIEEAYEKLAYMTLNYVKQFWTMERKIKVTGLDGFFDIQTFEGSDLRDNTDVKVEGGSSLPVSRAAKQAFILDLMKFGFIDPQKGLEVLEIGGINKIYEQIQVDLRQAQRENLRMSQATAELLEQHKQESINEFLQAPENQALMENGLLFVAPDGSNVYDLSQGPMLMEQGVPEDQILEMSKIDLPLLVPVNTWDDHRIHINEHNKYRKSQAFEQLSKEAKTLFEDHVKQHVAAIMVGAAGALPPEMLSPELLEAADNQESVKEMEQQAQTQGMEM